MLQRSTNFGPTQARWVHFLFLAVSVLFFTAAGCQATGGDPAKSVANLAENDSVPSPAAPSGATVSDAAATVDHSPWASFLAEYVTEDSSGLHLVNYAAISNDALRELDAYLETLRQTRVSDLGRDEQMAFWINLYNALTIQVVQEHYPVESILEIRLTEGKDGPWDAKLVQVEGRSLSLNEIEHQILRPTWKDPRIHYAVNCASIGCPNLAKSPFFAETLESDLDRAAQRFINHPRAVQFTSDGLILSRLYDWYRTDFGSDRAEVFEHLRTYAAPELAQKLDGFEGKLDYQYDWNLNERGR